MVGRDVLLCTQSGTGITYQASLKVCWIFSMVKRFDREFSLLKKGREKHQRSMCLYTGQKEVLNLVPVYLTECLFTLRAGGARGKLGGTSG